MLEFYQAQKLSKPGNMISQEPARQWLAGVAGIATVEGTDISSFSR